MINYFLRSLLVFQDSPFDMELEKMKEDEDSVNISMTAAAFFVLFASAFLLLLYFFLSEWTIWILVVIFCIAGVEVGLLRLCILIC